MSFFVTILLFDSQDSNEVKENEDTAQMITENEFVGTYDSKNDIYYLHNSKIEKPEQDKCYAAQIVALKDLTDTEKSYVQKEIRIFTQQD